MREQWIIESRGDCYVLFSSSAEVGRLGARDLRNLRAAIDAALADAPVPRAKEVDQEEVVRLVADPSFAEELVVNFLSTLPVKPPREILFNRGRIADLERRLGEMEKREQALHKVMERFYRKRCGIEDCEAWIQRDWDEYRSLFPSPDADPEPNI